MENENGSYGNDKLAGISLNVAIVEDERESLDTIKKYLDRFTKEFGTRFNVTAYGNGMEFLDDFNPTFDIVFMDIEMPYINGIETAKRLRGIDRSVCLLFVTNMFQFAVKGYEVDAMDFVVKPIDYFSFKEKIGKAVRHCVRKTARHIVLKLKSGFKKFKTDDIFYVESIGHTLRYLTAEGPFELRGTMQDAENMLKGCGFSRCSNSFLVNLKHIKEMTGNSIKICDTEIAVGRTKKRSFMNDLTDYLGGMI